MYRVPTTDHNPTKTADANDGLVNAAQAGLLHWETMVRAAISFESSAKGLRPWLGMPPRWG